MRNYALHDIYSNIVDYNGSPRCFMALLLSCFIALVLVALVQLAHIRTVAIEHDTLDALFSRYIGGAVVDTDVDIARVRGDWGLAGCLALGLAWGFRCGALAVC